MTVQYDDDASATRAMIETVFGHPVSEEDLAAISGAHPGDTIHVWTDGPDMLSVRVEGGTVRRDFTVARRGDEIILDDEYTTNTGPKTASSGADLVRGMENMQRVGISRITCTAARGSNMNGYYTWARLGFTGKIPVDDMPLEAVSELRARFGNVSHVEQLMRKPGGAHWWKQNGISWEASFSFKNRYSLRILAYFKQIVSRHGADDDIADSGGE